MRRTIGLLVALAVVLTGITTVTAAPLRSAQIGDRAGSLTVGLAEFHADDFNCGAFQVAESGWVRPGDPKDEDHAIFMGGYVDGTLRVVTAYDASDPSLVVETYLIGKDGLVHELIGPDDHVCEPASRALKY